MKKSRFFLTLLFLLGSLHSAQALELPPEMTETIEHYLKSLETVEDIGEIPSATPAIACAAVGGVGMVVGEKAYEKVKEWVGGDRGPAPLILPEQFNLTPTERGDGDATPAAFALGFVGGMAAAASRDVLGQPAEQIPRFPATAFDLQ